MPLEVKVENTPLKLLRTMEKWVEGQETIADYVQLCTFYGVIYKDKRQWNSNFSIMGGEFPMWAAQIPVRF